MNNLSNILQMFSNENLKTDSKHKSTSKEDIKELLKTDKTYSRMIFAVASESHKSTAYHFAQAQECLKEARVLDAAFKDSWINREKKIASLKTMKASGASMEQLAATSELYSIEGFVKWIVTAAAVVQTAIYKIIEFFKKIWQTIISWFTKNKDLKKLSQNIETADGKKTIQELVKEKPDLTIKAKYYKKDPKKTIEEMTKSFEETDELTQEYNELKKSVDVAVSSGKEINDEVVKTLGTTNKALAEGCKKLKEERKELYEGLIKEVYHDGDRSTKEMKLSEFFFNDGMYYIYEDHYVNEVKACQKGIKYTEGMLNNMVKDVKKYANDHGKKAENNPSLQKILKEYMKGVDYWKAEKMSYVELLQKIIPIMLEMRTVGASVLKQVSK